MKRNIIFKIVLIIIFLIGWKIIFNYPTSITIVNQLALNQMNNSADSSIGMQTYQYLQNYQLPYLILCSVVIFYKEIKRAIKKLIENIKGEK